MVRRSAGEGVLAAPRNGHAMSHSSAAAMDTYALYARVSSDDQAERGTIQSQQQFLERYVGLYNLPVARTYLDDGLSGSLPLHERPGGAQLLQDAARGLFGVVLVYRVDRLSRSLFGLLDAHRRLQAAGVAIQSATEPFDTRQPIGSFLFQLLGSLAELEKATIVERLTLGRDRTFRQGRWPSGPVPYGYDLDPDRHLVPSERRVAELGQTEADVVRDLFRRLAAGEGSLVTEARRLTQLRVPRVRRWGNGTVLERTAVWHPSTLSQLAHSPVYAGTARLRSRHGTVETAVPALVDFAIWERVQQVLRQNRRTSAPPDARPYLLRGLIVCGTCGHTYGGAIRISHTDASGRIRRPYYQCNGRILGAGRFEDCHGRGLSAAWLEEWVWQDCLAFLRDPGAERQRAEAQARARQAQRTDTRGRQQVLERELAAKATERSRVLTLYRRGLITPEEADRELEQTAAESATLQAELDRLRAEDRAQSAWEDDQASWEALAAQELPRAEELDRTRDIVGMRALIERLVTRIVVTSEDPGRGKHKKATVELFYTHGDRSPRRQVFGRGVPK